MWARASRRPDRGSGIAKSDPWTKEKGQLPQGLLGRRSEGRKCIGRSFTASSESTAELKGLLRTLMRKANQQHKIVGEKRPNFRGQSARMNSTQIRNPVYPCGPNRAPRVPLAYGRSGAAPGHLPQAVQAPDSEGVEIETLPAHSATECRNSQCMGLGSALLPDATDDGRAAAWNAANCSMKHASMFVTSTDIADSGARARG